MEKTESSTSIELDLKPSELETRAGDRIVALAHHYAEQVLNTPFGQDIRQQDLSPERYRNFKKKVYPLATEFNHALIEGIGKIPIPDHHSAEIKEMIAEIQQLDHVGQANVVIDKARRLMGRVMAEIKAHRGEEYSREDLNKSDLFLLTAQLFEEQGHNNYFRDMLYADGLTQQEVKALTDELERYLGGHSAQDLDNLLRGVLGKIGNGSLPDPVEGTTLAPEVVALSHYLRQVARSTELSYIITIAILSAIELVIFEVASKAIYVDLVGPKDQPHINTELVPDYDPNQPEAIPPSIRWWDEHADYGKGGSVEARHIKEAVRRLNNQFESEEEAQIALGAINQVLALFAATAVES